MDGLVGVTSQFEEEQIPLAIAWMENRGHKVAMANCVGWDAEVNGNKEEWKFLKIPYQDFYFEIFQCADPWHCPYCIYKGHTHIKLGWAHRNSYCKADVIRIFWGDGKIAQVAAVSYKQATDWLWDERLSMTKPFKGIPNWDGRCRTLGIAVPFNEMPGWMKMWKEEETPALFELP